MVALPPPSPTAPTARAIRKAAKPWWHYHRKRARSEGLGSRESSKAVVALPPRTGIFFVRIRGRESSKAVVALPRMRGARSRPARSESSKAVVALPPGRPGWTPSAPCGKQQSRGGITTHVHLNAVGCENPESSKAVVALPPEKHPAPLRSPRSESSKAVVALPPERAPLSGPPSGGKAAKPWWHYHSGYGIPAT